MTVTTARGTAIAKQDRAIADNVAKIEEAKRRPSALALMASRLNISEGMLTSTLKKTVFKECRSDEEFAALIVVANEYGLNPLTKEIYAFPAKGGGVVPMVGIDGWVKIMNSHPQFDGIEFNDLPDANGKLYAIEAVIYRKDRSRPIRVVEYLEECKRNTEPWNKSPARLLRHRSLIQAARYAFGFSGIYADDEADVIGEVHLVSDAPVAPMRSAKALPAHDPETGEIDEEVARQADRAAYREIDEKSDTKSPRQSSNDATGDGPSGQESDGQEASDQSQAGETVTLASALDEIKRAELVADVNSRVSALQPLLSDADAEELRSAAMDRIAELKAK